MKTHLSGSEMVEYTNWTSPLSLGVAWFFNRLCAKCRLHSTMTLVMQGANQMDMLVKAYNLSDIAVHLDLVIVAD